MRSRILILALATSLISSLGSCGTLNKVDQAVAWANGKFEAIDEQLANVKDYTEEKVAKIEADQAKFEARTGAWDKDLDGYVTVDEAKALVGEIAADPSKWDLLLNPDLWTAIVGTLGVSFLAKKGIDVRKKKKDAHDEDRFEQAKEAAVQVLKEKGA